MKIDSIKFLFLTSILAFSPLIFLNVYAQSDPVVMMSPGCVDLDGYGIKFNVNGFEPNSNVHWQVIHPDTNSISSFGYFSTNGTGGFHEDAFIEGPLVEGGYQIQFFDDADNDGIQDEGKKIHTVSMSVPCDQ